MVLVDSWGRTIDYLRISVIDRCNVRCIYCMPEDGVELLPRDEILSYEEILDFSKEAVRQGIKKIRLTGGEPLIRRDIIGFVDKMAKIEGLEDLSMTTNGLLLEEFARDLKRIGLARVNIGIDTLDSDKFKEITRGGDVRHVIRGIEKAIEVDLSPVKINVVMIKGINDDLTSLIKFAADHPVYVRFIEYMPIGNEMRKSRFISAGEIRKMLEKFGNVHEVSSPTGFGPARRYFRLGQSVGAFSIIPAMSEHFCDQCNRLRLTADGKLRLCLFSGDEVNILTGLRPVVDKKKIGKLLKQAVRIKPKEHGKVTGSGNGRAMSQIGG